MRRTRRVLLALLPVLWLGAAIGFGIEFGPAVGAAMGCTLAAFYICVLLEILRQKEQADD